MSRMGTWRKWLRKERNMFLLERGTQLGQGHGANGCARRGTCFYWREEHSSALCPKRENKSSSKKGSEPKKQEDNREKSTVTFDSEVSRSLDVDSSVHPKGKGKEDRFASLQGSERLHKREASGASSGKMRTTAINNWRRPLLQLDRRFSEITIWVPPDQIESWRYASRKYSVSGNIQLPVKQILTSSRNWKLGVATQQTEKRI
uniref:Holocytochrome c-type synthase n=1 Tax=Ascaris lumbricoides TaxID=6252 RepID=A0A0M3HS77_ASCLU